MTDWAAAETDYLDELSLRPAARRPATFGEIAKTSFMEGTLFTPVLSGLPAEAAFAEYQRAVEGATGKDIFRMANELRMPLYGLATREQKAEVLDAAVGTLDPAERQELAGLADWRARAAGKVAEHEERLATVQASTYSLSGNALAFAATLAGGMSDPAFAVTAPIGGPLGGPILKTMVREGAIVAGVQAVAEPAIQRRRAMYGLEAGLGQAATDVAIAFGFGAALVPVLRGGAAAWRAGKRVVSGSRSAPFVGGDLDAAAMVAERNDVLDAQAVPPTVRGRVRAAERIDAAAAAMERGRFDPSRSVADAPASPVVSADVYGPPRPDPTLTFRPERVAYFDGDRQQLIRPAGGRLDVRPAVMELADLTVSHSLDGVPNAAYPAALQPRDRSSAASRSFVAERAAELEPELLGLSPTAAEGAPVIGPDGVVESGNGRAMMIARAYDRHPERAAAYRAALEGMGYDLAGFKHPVLVRIREGDVADRAAFAREANVSPVAGLSVRERAFADASRVDEQLMALWSGGETAGLGNVRFTRAFADRVVAPEERPQFIDQNNRLSADGRARIEAALVARAWGEKDIVSALYEAADPSSKAILGAFADTAPLAARVKTAIAEKRIAAADDPAPALLEAYRIVDRARSSGQKASALLDQIDIETGAVPDAVRNAARLFFRDDELSLAAGREIVAEKIQNAMNRAIDKQNAIGDLFAARATPADNLAAARLAGESLDDQRLPEVKGAPPLAPADEFTAAAPPADMSAEEKAAFVAITTEADRVLEDAGGDLEIFLPGDDGTTAKVSARAAIAEADEDAAAAAELAACVAATATKEGAA